MSNYTIEHLRAFYNAGLKKIKFDDLLYVLEHLEGNAAKSAPKRRGRKPGRMVVKVTRPRVMRGTLEEKIGAFLSEQGPKGAHIRDIATAIKSNPANVWTWFSTTGKLIKTGTIKKVGPGTFAHTK